MCVLLNVTLTPMAHRAGQQRRGHHLGGRGGKGQVWLPGLSQGLGSGTPWASPTPHMAGTGASARQSHHARQGAQCTHARGTEGHVGSGGRGVRASVSLLQRHGCRSSALVLEGEEGEAVDYPAALWPQNLQPYPGPTSAYADGSPPPPCLAHTPHEGTRPNNRWPCMEVQVAQGSPALKGCGTQIQTGRTEVSQHRESR